MPIYEYECKDCHKSFEELVPHAGEYTVKCPQCGSMDTRKLLSVFSSITPHSSPKQAPCPSAASCSHASSQCASGSCPMH